MITFSRIIVGNVVTFVQHGERFSGVVQWLYNSARTRLAAVQTDKGRMFIVPLSDCKLSEVRYSGVHYDVHANVLRVDSKRGGAN